MKVGLFFGSFNPIHVGHLILANHIVENTDLNQVWFVVSPHNPLKEKKTLLADNHRYAMVEIALEGNDKLRASNIEFGLPQPNYTVVTLAKLKEKYPQHSFALIMGEDNFQAIDKWYNYEQILDNYPIIVYPRNEKSTTTTNYPTVTFLQDVPLMNISSTYIRNAIKSNKSVKYVLTNEVLKYIEEMNFYKKGH
ncbi:MAG TPA: nicotinate (nicotinamide) nucleotide adenylyltransferase [Crocinitomicaceae bacterium]|nr:nicotinate (nicotinamide) nucleotide adenylyltransferase [Crocinitomicaceae bacterium]